MLKEILSEFENLVETTDKTTPAYRQKKKELREKYVKYLEEVENLTPDKIKTKVKELGASFRAEESGQEVRSGKFTLDPLLRMQISDDKGIRYDVDAFLNTKIGQVNIGIDNEEVSSKGFKTTIDNYAETLEPEQAENLKYNLTKIRRAITRKASKEERVARARRVTVNTRKYIGATDLSKGETRAEIYDFWNDTSKKYSDFKSKLEAFFDVVEQSSDILNEFNPKITEEFKKIKNKYEDKNLEYIADFYQVNIPIEKDPKKRLIAAFDRIIDAEQLASRTKDVVTTDEEDDSYETTQRAWEAAYMEAQDTFTSGGERGEVEIGLADSDDVLDYDIIELKTTQKEKTDPLLAYEIMKNTKLLALDSESESILKEALDELKDAEIYLDFKTDLGNLINQLKDTLTISSEVYTLPVSVLENTDFKKFIGMEGVLLSAVEKKAVEEDVLEVIDDLFEELHVVLTDKKFGFAGGVRATGRGGTLGSALPPRQEARGTSMQSLVYEPKRQVPVNIATRGKLKQIFETMTTPLKELLDAYAEYYINPLYVGRLPIEIPLYSTGRGARSLSVFLEDIGGESITAGANIMLATTGRATLSVQTMRDLANFLGKLISPNIRVDDSLIRLAKNASIALTDIFGMTEKNRNYVSAVLKHFMELTEDESEIDEEIFGKRIGVRANEWQKEYDNRIPQPIFALPQFVDSQQSLMTKDAKRKEQYNRLRQVLDDVEDDLPLIFTKMLKAHDAIRKAMGKSVVYGFMPLTHSSYEKMVDLMYKEEQVDLSHLEVSNIVKSDDAHSNLSKEYGITTEQVYLIKANFR